MRIAVSGHNLSVDPGIEWVLQEPYDDPSVQQTHGIYLRSRSHGVETHVRGYEATGYALGLKGLLALLRDHSASAPFDGETMVAAPLTIVAGSFETKALGGRVVRELFITDGKAQANMAAIGTPAGLAAAKTAIDALVASIRFAAE